MAMKMALIIVVASVLLLGCKVTYPSTNSENVSSSLTLSKLIENVQKATVDDHADVFFIRIEGGLLPLPNTFVLHTLQTNGKLFRAELNTSKPDEKEKIYLSSIWVWNRSEKITQLHDDARIAENHKISKLLDLDCDIKAIVSYNEQPVPGFDTVVSMMFVDIGDQVIAIDSEIEKMLSASFESFARINCSDRE